MYTQHLIMMEDNVEMRNLNAPQIFEYRIISLENSRPNSHSHSRSLSPSVSPTCKHTHTHTRRDDDEKRTEFVGLFTRCFML